VSEPTDDCLAIQRHTAAVQNMKQIFTASSLIGLIALAIVATGQTFGETSGADAQPTRPDGRVIQAAKLSLNDVPMEALAPGITRQVVHGTQSTFSRWELKAGSSVPLHHHVNEQITWIISGRAEVLSVGKMVELVAGDMMVFAPNVEHAFTMLEDTIAIDIFAPARQDWIDDVGGVSYPPPGYLEESGLEKSVEDRAFETEIDREAQRFMDDYAADLRNHDRSALAARYDRSGATVIFNGERNVRSFDEIQARYRDQWTGPSSFKWRNLAYAALSHDSIIVTGEFDWGAPSGIVSYSYSGVLQRQEGELRIRLEVESSLPNTPDGKP